MYIFFCVPLIIPQLNILFITDNNINSIFVFRKYDSESALSSNTRKVTLDPDFHFFSDTELTNTTADSRPSSPTNVETVQSDTEFEVKKSKGNDKTDFFCEQHIPTVIIYLDEAVEHKGRNSWAWGQFPSVSQNNAVIEATGSTATEQDQHNSMLTSMFSFMKQSKHRSLGGSEGIYLADLSSGSIDPEVAAVYFNNTTKKQTTGMVVIGFRCVYFFIPLHCGYVCSVLNSF